MTHPTIRRLAVAALALSGLAACQQPAASGALTREQYIEQANAVCAEGNAEMKLIGAKHFAAGPPTGDAGVAALKEIVESSNAMIDKVDALQEPADMEAEMNAIMVDARATMTEIAAMEPEAFFAMEDDPFADVNMRLEAAGLTECAKDPMAEE